MRLRTSSALICVAVALFIGEPSTAQAIAQIDSTAAARCRSVEQMAYLNDKWIWFSFGLGLTYVATATALGVLSWRIVARTAPSVAGWTRAWRAIWLAGLLAWVVGSLAYGYGGMYYCITYLQAWSGENEMTVHHDIFSGYPYASAFMIGLIVMLPILFWSLQKSEARWGSQIRKAWPRVSQ